MVTVTCENCGRLFSTYPSRIRPGKSNYCSLACSKPSRIAGLMSTGRSTRYQPGYTPVKDKRMPKGPDNYAWKGEEVGYRGLHYWIRRMKGAPKICEHCGATNERLQWANIDGQYRRRVEDYIGLCASCHKKHDLVIKASIQDSPASR